MRRVAPACLALCLALMAGMAQAARVALVIGNDAYTGARPLKNARADARAMARALTEAGFQVDLREDADRAAMNEALRNLKGRITGGDEVVLYYAGHGVELAGSNLLLPVNVKPDSEESIRDDAVPLQRVLRDLEQRKPRFTMVILDACRNDPFEGSGRDLDSRGLVPTMGAKGQMVIYASGAGQKALDRLGPDDASPNGLFTRVFVEEMRRPGQSVLETVSRVRERVVQLAERVGHEQVPAVYDQSVGSFQFVRGERREPAAAEAPVAPVAPAVPAGPDLDEKMWLEAKSLDTVEGYDAYLESHPGGRYARFAQAARQKRAAAAAPPAPVAPVAAPVAPPADDSPEKMFTDFVGLIGKLAGAKASASASGAPAASAANAVVAAAASASAPGGRFTGKAFRDCPGCPDLVAVPPGAFDMGAPAGEPGRQDHEGPVHRVSVRAFALSRHEVTRGEFRRFLGETGRRVRGCLEWDGKAWTDNPARSWENPGFAQGDDHPVTCVSWDEAHAYTRWLSDKSGKAYRLPSEAEWEYAARAGTRGLRPWDDAEACAHANLADQTGARRYGFVPFDCDDGHAETAPVGRYRDNVFGLKDMMGNVLEWVEDCWNSGYAGAPADGSAWRSGNCSGRLVRGGAWPYAPAATRVARREAFDSGGRYPFLGFRVARTLP